MKPKILIIVGPTASGKSDLAVNLALALKGEVISADSRQVYKGLDIGTGKITQEEMKGVPHHLLDIADPNERFSAADWKRAAEKAIDDIISRGKLPIICGGTGFYIDVLVKGLELPDVEVDEKEQDELEKRPVEELISDLEKIDPQRAAQMRTNDSFKNPRRVARSLLVAKKLGAVPLIEELEPRYDATWVGILPPDATIRDRIYKRLTYRLDHGMVEEAGRLHEAGLSYERMDDLGLEYRYLAQFVQGKINVTKLINELATKIWQYARRQKTWWKRNPKIQWFNSAPQPGTTDFDAMIASVR